MKKTQRLWNKKKYTGERVKSETFFRTTVLNYYYNLEFEKIRERYSKKSIFLIMDETADASGRSILNILVGECSEVPINPPSLLKTTELSKTNSETIVLEIMNTLSMLFKNDTTKYKNLKLLLTDAAPYALKVGRILKEMIPGLMHVTCICHALHNLCESIRDANSVVNDCIVLLKKLLVKNKANKDLYYEKTSLRMPKFSVLTRWGIWIDCVVFHSRKHIIWYRNAK